MEKANYTDIKEHIYNHNESVHWIDCKYCYDSPFYEEHTIDDSGYCTVCDQPISPTEGVVYEVSSDGTYAVVIGYTGAATKVNIASEYQGLPVKTIYNKAFRNSNITAVTIPDSVTTISDSAFYSCSSLTSVVIPDSVTTIGSGAFGYCSNLLNIVIPKSVKTIGGSAFSMWNKRMFIYCEATSKPDGWNNNWDGRLDATYSFFIVVWGYAGDCGTTDDGLAWALTNTGVAIVDYIGTSLDVVIPEEINDVSVVSIARFAFRIKSSITSVIIPNNVISIGERVFEYCKSLTSVTIGNGVTGIGDYAFQNCDSLTSIVIGDSVEYIGDGAFAGCTSLTSVVIPDSVTTIGSSAFDGCSNLKSVYYGGTVEDWAKISIGSYNSNLTSATRYYYYETALTGSGNYWHYDEDGNVVVW